jgi:hypothetical protein
MLGGLKDPVIRKPEKENMAEFVAKKREVFLVQVCSSFIFHKLY